jgi:hypothetical protein
MRGFLRALAWCLLGSFLGSLAGAALGWGVGTIDVLYGRRPSGEFQSMPEFGRAMLAIMGAIVGALCGPIVVGVVALKRRDRP